MLCKGDNMEHSFEFELKTKIICGIDKHQELGEIIKGISQTDQVVIVTDKGVLSVGLVDVVEEILVKSGIQYEIFSDLDSEPTVKSIDEAASVIRKIGAGCVIGVGGGSAMDVAKMASLVAGGEASATHYELMKNPFPASNMKTVMIPTTSGTGAEVTSTVIFSNEKKRKVWGWDERLAPDVALLDPIFTVGLPAHLTAATTLDALIHAMEACTGKRSNSIIEAYSLKSIELISRHLLHVLENPQDSEGRCALALGATLGGVAIENGGTGIAHCIGHALGTLANIHHGKAVAVSMLATYHWNVESNIKMHAKIAQAMGVDPTGLSISELAYQGADRFHELVKLSKLDTNIDDKFLKQNIDIFVETMLAEENSPMLNNNCRLASEDELKKFAITIVSNEVIDSTFAG